MPADFSAVIQNGKIRRRAGCLSLAARPGSSASARLGMVIGKRHVRRATERNRIRRIIRESFRQRRERLPAVDLVIMVRKPSPDELRNEQLFRTLDAIWDYLEQRG